MGKKEEIEGDFHIECDLNEKYCRIYVIGGKLVKEFRMPETLWFEGASYVEIREGNKLNTRITNAKCKIEERRLDCFKRV